MQLHIFDRAGRIIHRRSGHAASIIVQPVHRFIMGAHEIIGLGRAGVIVERHAGSRR